MSRQLTFAAIDSATSSQASECGRTPCASPVGPMIAKSGPGRVPASPSLSQAPSVEQQTNATSGPSSSGSSASSALQSLLASRLAARLPLPGLMLYRLTWKERVTPLGRPISALRALVLRTSDSGCIGWATPASREAGGTAEQFLARKQKAMESGAKLGVSLTSLSLQAQLAGWPTPTSCSPATENYNEAGDSCNSRKTRLLVSGETPTGSPAPTEERGQLSPEHSRWLIGLPAEWGNFAPTATRSARRSQKRS